LRFITIFFSLLFIFNSAYSDLTIDSKNRVIFLSARDRVVEDINGSVLFSLDSMFAPRSISSSFFSIWVTSSSEFTSQKYSLWGEFFGKIKAGGNDIDANEKGILIAGEQSYLIQTSSGARITVAKTKKDRCILSKDSLYLYGNDTLSIFKREGKFVRKKFIPGVKDLCLFKKNLCFLFSDSLVLNDTTLPIFGGTRVECSDKFIAVLSDSGVVYYPTPN
jgi:hypothetical protein